MCALCCSWVGVDTMLKVCTVGEVGSRVAGVREQE